MALYQKGILGDFWNKVGTVVGRKWYRGKFAMASYAKRVSNPNTEAQQLWRARFATLGELATAMQAGLNIGLLGQRKRRVSTAIGEFVKINVPNVQAATPDSVSIDYTGIIVAKGHGTPVQFDAPQFDNPLQVAVTFDANNEYPYADDNDDIYVMLYNPDAKQAVLGIPAKRSVGRITIDVPSFWSGMKVHCWGWTVGGGIDNKGRISNSAYIGSGNIS